MMVKGVGGTSDGKEGVSGDGTPKVLIFDFREKKTSCQVKLRIPKWREPAVG